MVTTKRTGPANLQPRGLAVAVAAAFLPLAAHGQITTTTLPTGFTNVVGGATATVSGSTMNVNSVSSVDINNFQTFSIGQSATVNFNQLGASSVSLNRVVGNNPSEIFGRLTANGQIFLVNNNGVLFARGSSVDVGSLFVTSLSIADKDFLAGRYQFFNPGNAGAVINQGNIITANGFAALAGPQVRNDGVIIARSGSVALAAGDRVSLDIIGDGLINVSVDQAALNASAINTGTIEADGGMVLLTARSANALLDTVINNSGVIRANSLIERNGEIVLDGGSTGVVSVTGTLEAAGTTAGTTGGTIKVLGDKVGLFDGANLNASGDAGGGTVLVGGNFQGNGTEQNAVRTYVAAGATINADAITNGDGGRVIVWADDITRFYGTISARGGAEGGNGGFAEVSGKGSLNYAGFTDLRAPKGTTGTLLLDPKFILIDAGGGAVANTTFADDPGGTSTISGANLATAIEGANVTLQANTDITFNDTVDVTTGQSSLTVQAGRSIIFTANGNLSMAGAFSATFNDFNANVTDRDPGAAGFIMDPASSITARAGITIVGGSLGPDVDANTGDITLATLSTSSNTSALVAGNISVTNAAASGKNITVTGNLTADGFSDNPNGSSAGAINLIATGTVAVSNISAVGGSGSGSGGFGGDITLLGGPQVSINGDITTAAGSGGGGIAGTVNVTSAGGITVGGNVSGAAITFDAGTDVAINDFAITAANSTLDIKIGQAGGNGILTISANATLTANAVNVTGHNGTDTIAVTRDANMTLSDGSLAVDGAYNLTLASIEAANLTGGGGDNIFTVSSWTGSGSLTGGGGSDSVVAANKDFNFNLSDTQLDSSDNMNLTLSGIGTANLSGGAGNNTFTVASWTGNATVGGGAGDDVFNVTLSASGTVVAGGAGGSNDTLNVFGSGAINVNATAVENGQVVNYTTAMERVNVLGQGGSDTVTITATSGNSTYSIDGGGGTNAVVVSTDANFTLANASLQVNGSVDFLQPNISLVNVTVANLTGGGSDNTFTVSGWTGTGALDGSTGSDSVIASKDVNFTLSNAALTSNDSMSLALSSIEVANLTGGASNNSFTVSGWNGTGTFDGGTDGTGDRIIASNNVNFTLSNTQLQRSGMTNQTLGSIEAATLTGGVGDNTFNVTAWTGLGTLNGGGSGTDTVLAVKDANFTLTNTQLTTSDGMSMTLALINRANLTGSANANTFNVNSFQAVANLDGGGGADTFNLTLSINNTYNVNGGADPDTVNVLGTTGADNLVISSTSVVKSGSNETVTYTNVETMVVQGAGGGDTFTFASVAPNVTYSVQGTSGVDTLDITLLNQNITLTAGTNDGTISNVGSFTTIENLVGADTLIGGPTWNVTGADSGTVHAGGPVAFTFLGTGNLVGSTGNDTFTMQGGTLSGSISGGGGVDTLASGPGGSTFGITGANSGTVNGVTGGWNGISNLLGGTGSDTFNGGGGSVITITDVAGGTATLNGTVQTSGNQTYSGAVTLGSATTVTSTGAAVNFGSTVNGAFDLTANAATSAAFNGSVNIGSLSVAAPAISLVGVTTTGAQTYTGTASVANTFTTNGGAFTVNGGTVVTGNAGVNTGAGAATFNGTVNGPGQLTVNGNGTTFNDQIGNTSALAGLLVSGPVTFNTGTVNTAGSIDLSGGVVTVPGAITFSTGGGTFNASNAGNDFQGTTSVVTGSGGINLRDANNLILGPINAGAGSVALNAGSLQGAGVVTGGSGSITSLADISGMGLNMPGNMAVSGTGGVQTFSFTVAAGASQPGSYTQGGDVAVFINNSLAFPNTQHTTIGSVIGNAAQAAGAIIVEEANKTFGTDSVAEDIEYGFAGEIGATPPMDHRIDESGISLPRCVQESREGLPCK